MKRANWIYCLTMVSAVALSCSEESACSIPVINPNIGGTEKSTPFTGVLEVYPISMSGQYFGNYRGNPPKLTAINAIYSMVNGVAESGVGSPILLPAGTYQFLCWGYTIPADTTITYPTIDAPVLRLNADLSQQTYALRPISYRDTLCSPVYNYMYALKTVTISDTSSVISFDMRKVIAGLKIVISKADNSAFDSSVSSIDVTIGSISQSLNMYSAEQSPLSKTVLLSTRFNTQRMAVCNTVTLFPSNGTPTLQIRITLTSGTVKTCKFTMSEPLVGGTLSTLKVRIGDILTTPTVEGNDFNVENYSEEHGDIGVGAL